MHKESRGVVKRKKIIRTRTIHGRAKIKGPELADPGSLRRSNNFQVSVMRKPNAA
jgi:hypothetical protein